MRKVLCLLGYLTDSDIEWLLVSGTRQVLPAGTVLIREKQSLQAVYIVLAGTLEVSFATSSPRQPVRLGSGELVGEMSFIDARPPSATVTIIEEATVFAIPRELLARKLEDDPGFAARFYHGVAVFLSMRLRQTQQKQIDGEAAPEDEELDDLDTSALQRIQMAANRFDRVLKHLLAK